MKITLGAPLRFTIGTRTAAAVSSAGVNFIRHSGLRSKSPRVGFSAGGSAASCKRSSNFARKSRIVGRLLFQAPEGEERTFAPHAEQLLTPDVFLTADLRELVIDGAGDESFEPVPDQHIR